MPCFTMVPPRGDHPVHGHFWIPIDDENCWAYSFDYHPVRALTAAEVQAMEDGHGVHSENIPGTFRPTANKDNDYLIDREAQKRGDTYSGVKGIAMQDASLQESMGPIVDRTKEMLVSADSGIIKARQKLKRAVEALRDKGITPPGVDPSPSPGPLRGRRASEGRIVRRGLSRGPVGARGRAADVGMSTPSRPILGSSCARATTAAEMRYRIDRPIRGRRGARIIGLDAGAAAIVEQISRQRVGSCTVLVARRARRRCRRPWLRLGGVA